MITNDPKCIYIQLLDIIRIHLHFYVVPTIAHDHAYSRFLNIAWTSAIHGEQQGRQFTQQNAWWQHTFTIESLITWRNACVPSLQATNAINCSTPYSHLLGLLLSTLKTPFLNDVDTPAKVSCWNVWSLDHTLITISIHFQHQQHQLLRLNKILLALKPSDHSLNPVPPSCDEARGISKTSNGHETILRKGEVDFRKLRGPGAGAFSS